MFAEAIKEYRGVLCRRCCQPIPISARVLTLQQEVESRESTAAFAFAVRCRVCDHESVYTSTDVRRMKGEPPLRRLKARTARA